MTEQLDPTAFVNVRPFTPRDSEPPDLAPGWEEPPLVTAGYRDVRTGNQKLAILTASDLRMKVFPPIKWVVPELLVEGCTLFAGRPKLGKSWLMLDIALAVSAGRYSLSTMCPQGDVLYLALEDNERRLKGRIKKILGPLSEDWPERLHLATECPRSNEGGIGAIRAWAESVPDPRLVIIDVLAMFKPVRGDKESIYEADYHAIKTSQQLAADLGIAIVVVHHTRKGIGDTDPFEKVSGTLGLSGAADTTIILDRDQNGFTLYGRGRDIQEFEHAVSYSHDTCRFTLLGKAEEVRRTDERSTILSVLKDADEAMTPSDVSDAAGIPRNNAKQLLFKMAKAGEVSKLQGRGKYIHPSRSDLLKKPTPCNLDNPITNVSEIKLSVLATDFLKWLRSRSGHPVNAALITSHAPRHTRSKEVLPIVLSELLKFGLIRFETKREKGKKASRLIHLTDGADR